MQRFRDSRAANSLSDMGFIGDIFTWRGGRIRERIERVTANQKLMDLFPMVAVLHEEFNKSDHRSLLVDTEYYAAIQRTVLGAPRRFEARWLRDESVDSIIEAAWERAKTRPGITLAEATNEVH